MITLIASIICFILLFAFCCFIPIKKYKTLIMAGIVMLMLLITIVDQLVLPKYPLTKVKSAQHFQIKPLTSNVKLNISTQLYKNSPIRTLLKQQRTLLTYLTDKEAAKQNIIIYIKNIDNSRFRAVFRQFQSQTNAPAVYIDFSVYDYTFSDLQTAITQNRGLLDKFKDKIVYYVIENIKTFNHVTALQNLFLVHNVSYIIESMPQNLLQMSSLGKWTYKYQFQGNYISQVLQNHPPRLVQICNKYRTIDYPFYIMSQTQPLSQLCTKLPTNQVTQCIRNYMQKAQDRIPYSKVRKCFDGINENSNNIDGVIYENGMIGLKKDYFYAGKVDKSLFTIDRNEVNQNL